MKAIIYAMLFVFWVPCNGQNTQHKEKDKSTIEVKPMDTLSILLLKNKHYRHLDYKVLRLYDLDNDGYWIDTTKRIELTQKNKTIASIFLPSSEDVINFSVSKIAETRSGFRIVVDWGGEPYYYHREFYFKFKKDKFYFNLLRTRSYFHTPEKETKRTKKIRLPSIPIDEFDILQYLSNE